MNEAGTTCETCWTPAWVQRITGGRWLTPPTTDPDAALCGLGIDTRTFRPGQVFLAVKGENFDGHAFVDAAIKAGAAMAIVERHEDTHAFNPPGLLLVDNTVEALHRLARAYRKVLRQSGCAVIAVVGSNGKTTTRHLIHTVLSARFKGSQSPKSFNNHLGVPLTILGAARDDRFVVAEVGTNHPGEIDDLGELLQPDAAIITSIGHEHMEFFGDLQGVAHEEASITAHLPRGGTLFIESDANTWVRNATSFNPPTRQVVYGYGGLATREQRQPLGDRQRFAISETTIIDLPLLAPHDMTNALGAIAVGRWMGVDDMTIKTALESVHPMPGRLVVKRFGPVTVIDDTYNANPDSVRAALDLLADYPADVSTRRVAILGDMLELGDTSPNAHREVGESLVRLSRDGKVQHVSLIGPLMTAAAEAIRECDSSASMIHYTEADANSLSAVADSIHPGDVVLCKGSRGLLLERLIPMIGGRFTKC